MGLLQRAVAAPGLPADHPVTCCSWREHVIQERKIRKRGVLFCYVGSNADLRVNCVIAAETYILPSADREEVLRTIADG